MGPPDVRSDEGIGPDHEADGEDHEDLEHHDFGRRIFVSQQHSLQRRPSIGWTVAYYTLLVGGAFGFYKGLWRLTESDRALVQF